MNTLLALLILIVFGFSGQGLAAECPHGLVYEDLKNGTRYTVTRAGSGRDVTASLVLDVIGFNGQVGRINGFMRSEMQLADPTSSEPVFWQEPPLEEEDGGFYRLVDNGEELFTMTFVGCAPPN